MSAETNKASTLNVAPSPHLSNTGITTKRMMFDVIIALIPAVIIALYQFQWHAAQVLSISILSCMIAEAFFTSLRGRKVTLGDGSAILTGLIFALSLPWSTPWYVIFIGAFVAIGLGKICFGGLGMNLFNPAMVGRAFVMLSFAKSLGASAYVNTGSVLHVVTSATPLSQAKEAGQALGNDILWPLFIGNVNGSLGEISAAALIVGGLYLCIRRVASWEIPLMVIVATVVFGGLAQVCGLSSLTIPMHLFGGALLFGAFFIATDPVTSPLTVKGKLWFGFGVGFFIVLLRVFSSYPEGVMFAVLLMNAMVPLINRWTIPTPVGGPFGGKK
jgi:electron transport complex protein RnfD